MQDFLQVLGLVVGVFPQGEYDRRITLLTKECGKVTAFVKGARRPQSRFVASTDMFAFGTFDLFVGKNSYNVQNVEISNYFEYLRDDLSASLYAMYFTELSDYYTREGNDEAMILLLLYRALQALKSPVLDKNFVKTVYEIRLFYEEGELVPPENISKYSSSLFSVVEHIMQSTIEKLFSFSVNEDVMRELTDYAKQNRKRLIDRPIKSLEMLELL